MSPSSPLDDDLTRHYVPGDSATAIFTALEKAEKDLGRLTPEDLAPMDDFHVRGRQAALELARAAGLRPSQHVLDVGSGLGGPSRCIARAFGPRGTLALYDVLAGPAGPVHFPVPWARGPATSFLVTPGELRQLLEASGFTIERWDDTTAAAAAWFAHQASKTRDTGVPPLGLHVVLGPEFGLMARNLRRSLDEGRVVLAQVVAREFRAP